MAFGMREPIVVIKKNQAYKLDSFKRVKILETVRVEFGKEWFLRKQLLSALNVRNIELTDDELSNYLNSLWLGGWLKKQRMLLVGHKGMVGKMHYALGKHAVSYLQTYLSFTNKEGSLYKRFERLYQRIANGKAARL